MKYKRSYFSVSAPLIKENMRRFWSLAVLGFAGYLVTGIIPILISSNFYGKPEESFVASRHIVNSILNLSYGPFAALFLVLAAIGAVIVFRYLHNSASVTMTHNLPVSRSQLFNSNFLSGLLLIWLPIIATGLILMIISRPIYTDLEATVNIFQRSLIALWIIKALFVSLSVYVVAVFAGVVSGNTAMHMFQAFWFNFLLPSVYGLMISYFGKFLYGFDSSSQLTDIAMAMMPYLRVLQNRGEISPGLLIYYILLVGGLLVLSSLLYHKRDLEKAGDSLVFKPIMVTIAYLIAFYGMTMMAFFFDSVLGYAVGLGVYVFANGRFYLGIIAGIIIFLFIGLMIVKKTPRVFNKGGLKHLVIYTSIALIFVAGVDLDISGFEKRVPNPEKVSEVSLGGLNNLGDQSRFSSKFFDNEYAQKGYYSKAPFSEKENIEAIIAFQKEIIADKPKDKHRKSDKPTDYEDYGSYAFSFVYNIKGGWDLKRSYNLTYDQLKSSKSLKKVFESKEFKNLYSFDNLYYKEVQKIEIYNDLLMNNTENQYSLKSLNKQEDIKAFMAAMEKDFQSRSWEEHVNLSEPAMIKVEIGFLAKDRIDYGNSRITYDKGPSAADYKNLLYMNISVRKSDRNTLAFLEERGFLEEMTIKVEDIAAITVVKEEEWEEKARVTFVEEDEIAALLESYMESPRSHKLNYYGIISFKKSAPYASKFYEYVKENSDHLSTEKEGRSLHYNFYFDIDNLPDIIVHSFN